MGVAKNYIYNVIYQIFVLITPLITVPYVARVLGSSGVGLNAYTNSIIQYFTLFGTIGISLYGNQKVAYVRDNKEQLSKVFWEILTLKLITTTLAYLVFLVFLSFVGQYELIFFIQSIFIISAAFDITWLFMGLEDFRNIVIRNTMVKLIGIACIFTFVHTADDLWKYIFALSLTEMFGQIVMWFNLPKVVHRTTIKWVDIKKHFIPALSLFLPQVAMQIYLVLNKTMLGYFSSTDEVGFFDSADKIVRMALTVVTAMGVVMLPRVSNTFAKGDNQKVKDYLNISLDFASYLSFPMMFGLAGIAIEFTPWYFGLEFIKTGWLIILISPIVVFIAWSSVLGTQYLMPIGKVRIFTLSVTIGAIINFALNLLLIHNFHSEGTAISALVAEFAVTFVELCFVWKQIEIKKITHSVGKYLVASLFMYIAIRCIGVLMNVGIRTTLLQILIGIPIYFGLLFLMKSQINNKVFKFAIQVSSKFVRKDS